ncbi:hypothetical protein [Oryzicola mucosus]|uniref:Lipoprotein n=1 Tax=Oryzicola mucosus TaxID=2767425 RepID=A0A8J6U185_9HYPH|nr:hypothetical protein [Oryzicola mucosus]MBD0416666.1 hypothetical protein [Oryzicola mucosus]
MKKLVLLLAASLSACTTYSQGVDSEVYSSRPYDLAPCAEVVRERDALAAQYPNLPPDRTERRALGAFATIPDFRSAQEKEMRAIKGKLSAMDRAIERRGCRNPKNTG